MVSTLVVLLISLAAVLLFRGGRSIGQDRPEIIASFYPLEEFASNLVGEEKIYSIIPIGMDPHDFEPTAQDIIKITNSKLLIYNGNGLEPWIEDFLSTEEGKEVRVLNISKHSDSLEFEDEHTEEVGDPAHEGDYDPHFWLDPVNAIEITNLLARELKTVYPDQTDEIEMNAKRYISELKTLDDEYSNQLARCEQRKIIVSHDAFNYPAKRYNFEVVEISGISPESEPSAQKLAQIARLVKDEQIEYIFYETLVDPKLAQLIAIETGASTLVLNPIENLTHQEEEAGESYLSIMRSNLDNLKLAMKCQ